MLRLAIGLMFAVGLAGSAVAADFTVPASVGVETLRVRSFAFAGGRTAPIKLAYRTLGVPRKGADGQIDNAVVLLHGTGSSGAAFLGPKATLLFGPGAPLDITRTFVILPDAIGTGGSSKPSDTLGVNFPHYDYSDIIRGVRTIVRDELKVTKLRLIVGVSMGAMLGWEWAGSFPDDVDTVVALGAWPTAVSGRNLIWRLSARDALLASPLPGGGGARVAAGIVMMATVPAAQLTRLVPDASAARAAIEGRLAGGGDPVDLAFQFDAVRTYNPTSRLERITAKIVALNFADDPLYPPEADPLPALSRRLTRVTVINVPASAATMGHLTVGEPAVWLPYVAPAIGAALGR